MKIPRIYGLAASIVVLGAGFAVQQNQGGHNSVNDSGISRTVSRMGALDFTGPFFQDLGSNGRRCVTCHMPGEDWSVSSERVRSRFEKTRGLDPIFRLNDGANSPLADVSTLSARRLAYSMLLNKGVFRVERPIPLDAEFVLSAVDDPYGYASATGLSLFRRPLPCGNVRFVSTVMWDGREVDPETPMTIENSPEVNREILMTSLLRQALDATNGHAEATSDITMQQRQAIVDFELALASAQVIDFGVGSLTAQGAGGGPENILGFPFYIGINDNVNDPNGPFDPIAMTLFDSWQSSMNPHRRAVARGQALFNTLPINIQGVKGLNDNPYFGSPELFVGTCTTCHNTPNVGNHSLAIALDIGLTDQGRRTPDMPLYTLMNKSTFELVRTTDPGLALSTGKWKDIGRFKGPILRGLAARPPYFHDGSAADIGAVLEFYRIRFGLELTPQQKADLTAFLLAL